MRFIYILSFNILFLILGLYFFSPILYADSIIIEYGINPFDICVKNADLWSYIKISFIFSYIFSSVIISTTFYTHILVKITTFFRKNTLKKVETENHNLLRFKDKSFKLYIGTSSKENIILPELSLYQNILITGTIGTGKTSSAMYPFTEQFIKSSIKFPMLILDVKGNYYLKVKELCEKYSRSNNLIILELDGFYTYNPLDKPNLKASVLADRLKNILMLFSPNSSESYWLDKAEQILAEAIKFCRLYNDNYVTFEEIHKIITIKSYYDEKLQYLREIFLKNTFNQFQTYDLLSCINFFEKEFFNLDDRTSSILKSEITRITNCFISDYSVYSTFCPPKDKLNFKGFKDVLKTNKIVVLNLNISEYKNLAKIIAAYLKLDFQTEVMNRLANNLINSNIPPVVFLCDEYSEYCTTSDSNFFSQSREAKCINIIATQSYTSLLNCLNNQYSTDVIIQNLVNKLWFRTDDMFTIESAQKQIGKEDKYKTSTCISENSNETNFSYISNTLNSSKTGITESINTVVQNDFIYDTKFFTQNLETFTCLGFLSTGSKIIPPCKINLKPYFKN